MEKSGGQGEPAQPEEEGSGVEPSGLTEMEEYEVGREEEEGEEGRDPSAEEMSRRHREGEEASRTGACS